MTDSNISKWMIEAETKTGETIDNEKWDGEAKPDENILLSREDGLKKLDQDYDSGFGGADCFPMYAWTKSRVWLISEYDGSTSLVWVPRHPVPSTPSFSGDYRA